MYFFRRRYIKKTISVYINFTNFSTIPYLIFVTSVSCGIHIAVPVALLKVNPGGCWIILYEYVPSSLALNLSSTDSFNLALIWESPLICGISFSEKRKFYNTFKSIPTLEQKWTFQKKSLWLNKDCLYIWIYLRLLYHLQRFLHHPRKIWPKIRHLLLGSQRYRPVRHWRHHILLVICLLCPVVVRRCRMARILGVYNWHEITQYHNESVMCRCQSTL